MPGFDEVPLPLKGLHLFTESEKQPPGTASEMVNCRTVDATSEKRRLSQRPGMVKHNSTVLDAVEPIMEMVGYTVTNKTLDYVTLDDQDITNEWVATNQNGQAASDIEADLYGNLYALDGPTAVSIYNPDGTLVNTVSPTLEHDRVGLGTLITDPLGGFIVAVGYVGGGDSVTAEEAATVHRYRPDEDYEYDEAWKINPGGYVADGLLFRGRLFLLVNVPTDNRSYVQVWDSVSSSSPAMRREWAVPHPASSIAVRDDGSVFVSSIENAERGLVPENPEYTARSVVWEPTDLVDYKKRIWSWFEAGDIGKLIGMEDGNEVTFWPDRSKNTRGVTVPSDQSTTGPVWRENGYAGQPSVEFRGAGGGYVLLQPPSDERTLLESGPNLSQLDKNRDDQRTIIPGYTEATADVNPPDKFSKFLLIGICRPTDPSPELGNNKVGALVHCGSSNASNVYSKVDNWTIQSNWTHTGASIFGESVPGALALFCNAQGGPSGTPGHGGRLTPLGITPDVWSVYAGDYSNPLSCGIFSLYACADWDVPVSDTSISSLWRVNGVPLDRFSMPRQLIDSTKALAGWPGSPNGPFKQKSCLGGTLYQVKIIPTNLGAYYDVPYQGDIIELICLHWVDDADAPSAPKTLLAAGANGLGVNGTGGWASPPLVAPRVETHGTHTSTPGNGTVLEMLEGYLAHKYGSSHILPDSGDWYEHPYRYVPPSVSSKPTLANLFQTHPLLTKWGPDGSFRWATGDIGGTGLGVAVGVDGNIFSSGDPSAGTATIRRIIDEGTNYSIDPADEAWETTLGAPDMTVTPMLREKLLVDEAGNLFLSRTCASPVNAFAMICLAQEPGTPGGGAPTLLRFLDAMQGGDHVPGLSLAFYPTRPDYRSDEAAVGNVEETLFLQLGLSTIENPGTDDVVDPLRRIRLVSATKNMASPRDAKAFAVMGDGTFRVFDNGTAVSTPTVEADAVLASGVPYYHAVAGFEKVFISDGEKVVYYDSEDDTVRRLKSNTYGTFQFRPEILEVWRDRLVGARFSDNPTSWFMSAVGDPFDHDIAPPVAVVTQAVAGTSPEGAGTVPDAVTGFAPVSDDWAIIGCSSSLQQLSGDPMQNGQHDLVSGTIGMAYGRAWCKDDRETLYFVSSDGSIYSMRRGERPVSMTEERIHSLTRDIDFTVDYVRMVWDQETLGFHVLIVPFQDGGLGPGATEGFYYSRRDDAWVQDEFGIGIRSATVTQGDRFSERAVILGGNDGFVRHFSTAATDDDGAAIWSRCLIGPLVPVATANEWLLDRVLGVLASELGDVQFEVLVGDTADTSQVVAAGTLNPGRNMPLQVRARGAAVWIRLQSAKPGSTWAVESIQAELFEGGPTRMLV